MKTAGHSACNEFRLEKMMEDYVRVLGGTNRTMKFLVCLNIWKKLTADKFVGLEETY